MMYRSAPRVLCPPRLPPAPAAEVAEPRSGSMAAAARCSHVTRASMYRRQKIRRDRCNAAGMFESLQQRDRRSSVRRRCTTSGRVPGLTIIMIRHVDVTS